MTSKEINKLLNQAEKETIKEIKRLYPLISKDFCNRHDYDTDLEFIQIDDIVSEYNGDIIIGVVDKANEIFSVTIDGYCNPTSDYTIKLLTIGDQLYILEELELLSKSQRKNKILKLQ